jgi:hypothetical protein
VCVCVFAGAWLCPCCVRVPASSQQSSCLVICCHIWQEYLCDLERPVMYGALLGIRKRLGEKAFPLIGA